MLDEGPFTVQMNENQALLETQLAVSSFISQQRMQKLDLLTHLISNLTQSFVIYGPNEVGKSKVLAELQQTKKNNWTIINIQAAGDLTIEIIEKQILDSLIPLNSGYKFQKLTAILPELQEQRERVVLLIDDAGLLAPDVISAVMNCAVNNEGITVVLSLTEEQLELKRYADELIDGCHFVAIPPITENQCTELLKKLSLKGMSIFSSDDSYFLSEKLFLKTQGLPGKITTEISVLTCSNAIKSYKWLLLVGFVVAVMVAGLKYLMNEGAQVNTKNEKIKIVLEIKPAIQPEPAFVLSEQDDRKDNGVSSKHSSQGGEQE